MLMTTLHHRSSQDSRQVCCRLAGSQHALRLERATAAAAPHARPIVVGRAASVAAPRWQRGCAGLLLHLVLLCRSSGASQALLLQLPLPLAAGCSRVHLACNGGVQGCRPAVLLCSPEHQLLLDQAQLLLELSRQRAMCRARDGSQAEAARGA